MSPIWGGKDPVGTDPWMACNSFTYRARTGKLLGKPVGYLPSKTKFGEVADTRTLLATTVTGSIIGKKRQVIGTAARAFFGLPRPIEVSPGLVEEEVKQRTRQEREQICRENAGNVFLAYKARPLNGIWATAPYLHNGSVRSLTELLLPPAQRAKRFPVGGRLLDVDNVGFLPEPNAKTSEFRVLDDQGRLVHGNDNAGHDYGNAGILPRERRALVEYMKSL